MVQYATGGHYSSVGGGGEYSVGLGEYLAGGGEYSVGLGEYIAGGGEYSICMGGEYATVQYSIRGVYYLEEEDRYLVRDGKYSVGGQNTQWGRV